MNVLPSKIWYYSFDSSPTGYYPIKKNTKMTVLRKKVMIHHRNFRVPFSQTKMRWSQVRHQLSYLWLITPFTEQLIRGMKLRAFLCCLFLQNSYLMHLCKLWVITSLPIIGLPWLLWHSARPCWRIYCWFLSFLAMPKKKPQPKLQVTSRHRTNSDHCPDLKQVDLQGHSRDNPPPFAASVMKIHVISKWDKRPKTPHWYLGIIYPLVN